MTPWHTSWPPIAAADVQRSSFAPFSTCLALEHLASITTANTEPIKHCMQAAAGHLAAAISTTYNASLCIACWAAGNQTCHHTSMAQMQRNSHHHQITSATLLLHHRHTACGQLRQPLQSNMHLYCQTVSAALVTVLLHKMKHTDHQHTTHATATAKPTGTVVACCHTSLPDPLGVCVMVGGQRAES
jgi:hypothetical protein